MIQIIHNGKKYNATETEIDLDEAKITYQVPSLGVLLIKKTIDGELWYLDDELVFPELSEPSGEQSEE